MEPLVSVIIPVYNVEKYISRCIESLINQTYHNIEILLIDDGSTDRSGVICDTYAEKDNRIRVFHVVNGGVSKARNLGLEEIRGEWVSFADSDDFVSEYYIERLLDTAINAGVAIATCNYFRSDESDAVNLPLVENSIPQVIDVANYAISEDYYHSAVWGGLYHRDIIENTRFQTDIFYGEDTLFFCELLRKAEKVAYLDEKLYFYIQYPFSLSHGVFDEKKSTVIEARERICELFRGTKQYAQYRVTFGVLALDNIFSMLSNESPNKNIYIKIDKAIKKSFWYIMRSKKPIYYKKYYFLAAISPAVYYKTHLLKKGSKNEKSAGCNNQCC